jgi:hypothetical protein
MPWLLTFARRDLQDAVVLEVAPGLVLAAGHQIHLILISHHIGQRNVEASVSTLQ